MRAPPRIRELVVGRARVVEEIDEDRREGTDPLAEVTIGVQPPAGREVRATDRYDVVRRRDPEALEGIELAAAEPLPPQPLLLVAREVEVVAHAELGAVPAARRPAPQLEAHAPAPAHEAAGGDPARNWVDRGLHGESEPTRGRLEFAHWAG